MKLILFLSLAFVFSSCDAFVSLSYYVKNKSAGPVTVFVPGYMANGAFGRGVDTTLQIAPHSGVYIGGTMPQITGPIGASRRIYREYPGFCGVKIISPDTNIAVPCTKKVWKFRRGISVLNIKH